jgi:predicted nucleic-acid-binding protein
VTLLLDTNILIRHFTGDPPEQAYRVAARIRAAAPKELYLLDVHVAECIFVLEGPYDRERAEVARLMESAMGVAAIEFENEADIRRALTLYTGGMDFADAYLVARAEQRGAKQVMSFDRFDSKLNPASSVRRVEP